MLTRHREDRSEGLVSVIGAQNTIKQFHVLANIGVS